eukprot:c2767_g1_i1.p1 GENE.c2767_g1_i1~~c2767_g1_i1.p1  ORF type:complete len:298 (-),score=73.89 c2767_g1_i1:28-921(-)
MGVVSSNILDMLSALQGVLLRYGPEAAQIAFCSPASQQSNGNIIWSQKALIMIGGLTDGLLATQYASTITTKANAQGWDAFQILIRSSYTGYGISSLARDSQDIDLLIAALKKQTPSIRVVVIGHSTGCQDAVWHSLKGEERDTVVGVVLQAPVSDREYLESTGDITELKALSKELVESGRGDHIMPRNAMFNIPLTAYRYHSFSSRLGDDDMFSSDLTDEEMKSRLGGLTKPCLIAFSMADEYVPKHVDKQKLCQRLKSMLSNSTLIQIENADHSLTSQEATAEFTEATLAFLSTI